MSVSQCPSGIQTGRGANITVAHRLSCGDLWVHVFQLEMRAQQPNLEIHLLGTIWYSACYSAMYDMVPTGLAPVSRIQCLLANRLKLRGEDHEEGQQDSGWKV